ncbi:MAG: GTPase Era [Patescibacteria group bacterium]
MKSGTVLILGRPNVGKSTFVNNVIGQKVAITSPKPQTTRTPIQAVYKEDRGSIFFVDTPGIFDRAKDTLAKKINDQTFSTFSKEIDVVLYMVDHTRKRDFEEAKVLGIVRKIKKPKILVINKIDMEERSFLAQYEFLRDEFENVYKISALNRTHVKPLLDKIFELLPDKLVNPLTREHENYNATGHPLLSMDSKAFVAELIREKIFLKTGEEIPYTITVVVDEITERNPGLTYVKARILTTDKRYKKMLIGSEGRKIKEFGSMARKEIALATNKKIYLDLSVEVDPHWPELIY